MITVKLLLIPLLLAASSLLYAAESAQRPNVLLVLLDDLGFSDLGCYGGEISTPNMDHLAKGGLRFTQMTTASRCCPSRAALLTGLYPGQAGIPNMGGAITDTCVTLAELLHDVGYQTYMVGKWHVGSGEKTLPTARGFEEFYGFTSGYAQDQWTPKAYQRLPEGRPLEVMDGKGVFYATDHFSDYALAFLKQAQKTKRPWFLYLAHSAPHFPVQAPMVSAQPFLDIYRKGWDVLRQERFERMKKIGLAEGEGWKLTGRSRVPVEKDAAISNGYSGKQNPAWDSLPAARREDLAHRMALYAAMVKHVDAGVGRIVAQLKAAGHYENTVILILSDNGACYEWGPFGFTGPSRKGENILYKGEALATMGGPGTHIAYGSAWANLCNTPFRLYKHFAHQGGMVTPFIVHWPLGIQAPDRWVRVPAHLMDVMPTLAELSGATYPVQRKGSMILPLEGVSLTPLFQATGTIQDRVLGYQHEGARALLKGNWKLVMGKRFPETSQWELYDLSQDPCETKNLAHVRPEQVKALADTWNRWAERTHALGKPNTGSVSKERNK